MHAISTPSPTLVISWYHDLVVFETRRLAVVCDFEDVPVANLRACRERRRYTHARIRRIFLAKAGRISRPQHDGIVRCGISNTVSQRS